MLIMKMRFDVYEGVIAQSIAAKFGIGVKFELVACALWKEL